jgi:hypothetical protein
MKAHNWMALLLICVVALAGACKSRERAEMATGSEPAVTQTQEKEAPGTSQPNDLNPVTAQTMIDDVTLGHRVAADGTIPAADQGDDFAPGQPIYLTMKVGDAPAGSEVKVAWYGPGEQKVKDQQKTVSAGQTYLTFKVPDTGSWQKGDYRAEIWIGDEKVNQQELNITDKTEAGK